MLKRCLAVVFMWVVGVTVALAHNPRVELEEDWGDFAAPYIVEDGTVSFAFFGFLDEGDVDVFRLTFADDALVPLEILVPACGETYADFYPEMWVMEAADHADFAALETWFSDSGSADDAPDGFSVLAAYTSRLDGDDRPTYFERHTQRDYYLHPDANVDVQAGDVALIVYDPAGVGGDYLLASGQREVFFPPLESEPSSVGTNWRRDWLRAAC